MRCVEDSFAIYYYNEENQLHKEDGPAVEYSDGRKWWYINGKKYPGPYTDEEWQRFVRKVLLLK